MLGLLGGTSWPSTPLYYRHLNEMVQTQLGGHHSANILLRSIDYHPIKSLYHHGWDKIPALLRQGMDELVALKPDGIILCNNTLHKGLDLLDYGRTCPIPIFHAIHETGKALRDHKVKKVLLLATEFTMEDGFFAKGLEAFNIASLIPNAAERKEVGRVQAELAKGKTSPEYTAFFQSLCTKTEADAAVLACTELPLALEQKDVCLPLFNSIYCQCKAAVDFALA